METLVKAGGLLSIAPVFLLIFATGLALYAIPLHTVLRATG